LKPILVDTGAWFALVDRNDPDHQAVADAVRENNGRLLTTNFILDETLTLTRVRLGWNVAMCPGTVLRTGKLARLVRISTRDEEEAWTIFSAYSGKRFSFTDCTSFALCKRMKLERCLAIDRYFRSYSLQCIPRVEG